MRVLLARLTTRLRWSSPHRAAKLLMAFARAERSSYYDLIAAARLCSNPARRALYLRHACDESRHALMFTLRAEQLAADVAADPHEQHADFEHLYERLGETRFLAFVHTGERRGRAQLSMYRDELARRGDDKSRALLDAVLVDEARHEQYTREQLAQVIGEHAVTAALVRARGWELARSWLRAGRTASSLLFAAGMGALYLLLLPLALVVRARAPRAVNR
jgi:hypothetical protein